MADTEKDKGQGGEYMGISGVNGIGGMQDYSIQAPDYSRQPAKTVITEVPQQESRVASSNQIDISPAENTQAAEKKPSANAALEDISITFHKQDDFGYIGRDSDIHSLDVEKAISDMRKDQILQQYQYFVGNKTVFTE